jgi:hypothetical protein
MSSVSLHSRRPGLLPGYPCKRQSGLLVVLFLALCSLQAESQVSIVGPTEVRLGVDAQYSAQLNGSPDSLVVWSVNGFINGNATTGPISASGLYSPAATIWAGHSVKISVTTESTPGASASLSVKLLNPLPMFASGSITQAAPGTSFLLDVHGSHFVSGSQLLTSGAGVATVLVSSSELQSTISLPAGTSTVTVGILNPNATQKSPVSRILLVRALPPPALSAFSCASSSFTGSGSDVCSVLTTVAASSAVSVNLGSGNAAVTVPATVTVPANAMGATFTASVSSVTSAQAVTLTASAGAISKTFAVQLNAAVPTLTVSPANIAFGDVTVNTPVTQPVTLTSTGTAPVTVNSGVVSGTGFTMSSATFPVTLNPGLAVTLDVQFDPSVPGSSTGQLTVQSNSSTNSTGETSLSGTGEPHQVTLSWQAPADSSVPVAGYNNYRAPSGSTTFQRLNSSIDTETTYVDSTVQGGLSYTYYVTSVSSAGVESTPSNQVAATVP